jgi:hypothetical protein
MHRGKNNQMSIIVVVVVVFKAIGVFDMSFLVAYAYV